MTANRAQIDINTEKLKERTDANTNMIHVLEEKFYARINKQFEDFCLKIDAELSRRNRFKLEVQ